MRKTLSIMLAAALIFPFCRKDGFGKGDQEFGWVKSRRNNRIWEGSAFSKIYAFQNVEVVAIVGEVFDDEFAAERFQMSLPFKKGDFRIVSSSAVFANDEASMTFAEVDADAIGTIFLADTTCTDCQVSINSIDESGEFPIIEGTFNAELIETPTTVKNGEEPRRVKFKKGRFCVQVTQ